MKTKIFTVHSEFPERDKIAQCARIIREGGLVVFPTETVYGVAANADDPKAMKRLGDVKQRQDDKPFSVLLFEKAQVLERTPLRTTALFKVIDEFWPGPLTVVVPIWEQGRTIGLRIPAHPAALRLVQESGCLVAAPSANISGNSSPLTCEDALKDLDGLVDAALDAGPCSVGVSSSVVDMTQAEMVLLREGAISLDEVKRVSAKKHILMVCTGNSCRSAMAQYLLEKKLSGRDDITVSSAGTSVFVTAGASSGALRVLERRGIDASRHQSRMLTTILSHKADMIIAMTQGHCDAILSFSPDLKGRIHLLREFDPEWNGGSKDIVDPVGQADNIYEECAAIVERSLDGLLKVL